MAIDSTRYYVSFIAPVLPEPPQEYDPAQFNQLNNALRLYFNNLDRGIRDASTAPIAEAKGWFFS